MAYCSVPNKIKVKSTLYWEIYVNFMKAVKTLETPPSIQKPLLPNPLWKCPRTWLLNSRSAIKKGLLIIQEKTPLSLPSGLAIIDIRHLSDFYHPERAQLALTRLPTKHLGLRFGIQRTLPITDKIWGATKTKPSKRWDSNTVQWPMGPEAKKQNSEV